MKTRRMRTGGPLFLGTVLGLRLSQTEAYSRCGAALRPVRSSTARTEHRNQRFIRLAARSAVALNGANVRRRRISFVSFVALRARCALRALCSLRAGLPLRARHALDALSSLWTGRTLRTWISFRPGISAAASKCQCQPDREYR